MQFVRKAEEAITGKKGESHESTKSSNHGPHSSNLANKLDPRVDSDKDNRAAHTDATGAGLGTSQDTTTATGTHGTHGTTYGATQGSGTTHGTSDVTGTGAGLGSTHGTTGSTNVGPHSSNIANKADPRVDSDRDNRARHEGLTGAGLGSAHGTTHGTSGLTGTGAGLGSTHDTTATGTHGSAFGSGTGVPRSAPIATPGSSSTNAGPHSSNIANKLDPRVDSDRDTRPQQQSTLGSTGTGTTTHGSHTRGATVGSAIGGSGLGTASHHDAPAGSSYNTPPAGTTTGTTGPHSSSIANKLDPRVDSDAARAQNEGLHRQI